MPLREGAEQVDQEISSGVGDKGKEGREAVTGNVNSAGEPTPIKAEMWSKW